MCKFHKLIAIATALTALTSQASMYFCKSENMDRLYINYSQQTQVPTATYSFVPMGYEETAAPLDGRRVSVQRDGTMLSSHIEAEGKSIHISFEAADSFDEGMCRPSRDRFGMPILAPRCEKTATMSTTDEMGVMSTMTFSCEYLAD
jgi:hypothetical protein